MIDRKKPVQIMLDNEEHWYLSRYAAKQNKSIRQIVREQLMPLIVEVKTNYPRNPLAEKSRLDDVH